MDRMFCYVWSEKSNPNECKFGERWVKDGQKPEQEIWKRINDSVGVRKDLVRDGSIKLNWFGDVTEYATKVGRNYMHGRVDDEIRAKIGFRKGNTGEVHELPADEMIIRINAVLTRAGAPLPEVGLAAWQYSVAENVLGAIADGKRTIVAELCARFGKTIWAGAMIRETNAPLTIVASYVLTSFSSFVKDLTSFEQFKHLVHVDTKDDDYHMQVTEALSAGHQVVAYVSMCKGSKREERLAQLYNTTAESILTIIDEADYGVHKAGQANALISNVRDNDITILMTGTNSDRAVGKWNPDHYVYTTYPDLLMEKVLTLNAD